MEYVNHDIQDIVTPVDADKLEQLLDQFGYDADKSKFLVDGFRQGFCLQYDGPENVQYLSNNLKLTVGSDLDLWNKVMAEVKDGRYAGPFEKIPFKNYIQSPIGLVPKDQGKKT